MLILLSTMEPILIYASGRERVIKSYVLSFSAPGAAQISFTRRFVPVSLTELVCFCILKLRPFFAVIPCSNFWKGVFLSPLPTINEFVT